MQRYSISKKKASDKKSGVFQNNAVSRHVLLLPRNKVHFTDKKYLKQFYMLKKEHFDIKLIFEKTLIKTQEIFLH